jgi:hypothetical protein
MRNRGRRKLTVNRPKPKKGRARTEPKAMGRCTTVGAQMARELPQPAAKRARTQPGSSTDVGSRGRLRQEKRNRMPDGAQPKHGGPPPELRRRPPSARRTRQPVRFGNGCKPKRGAGGRRMPRRTSTTLRRRTLTRRGPRNARPEKPPRVLARQTRPRRLSALPGAKCGRPLTQVNAPERSRPLSGTQTGPKAVTRQRSSRRPQEKASVRGAAKGMRPRAARGPRPGRRPGNAAGFRCTTPQSSRQGRGKRPRGRKPNGGFDDMPKSRRAVRGEFPGTGRRGPRPARPGSA